MAEKRTCPICSRDWYSADTAGVWRCTCGAPLLKPGDRVMVLYGQNKGVVAVFKRYDKQGKAHCKGPGNRLHRVCVEPGKLRLIK